MTQWFTKAKDAAFHMPAWQRNLAAIWVGQLIAIAGFSVTLPFLPYYVQDLGITELEQVAFWSGLLTTAQATSMALVAPVWGSLADRYGRKMMVVRAMFGGAVVIGAMGFTQNVYQLLVLRAIQGTLTGTVAAATTLVVSSTPEANRGSALGMLQMAMYSGSSVGPLLGGLIADSLGYQATFWVTGALLLIAGVLVTAFVREEFTPPHEVEVEGEPDEHEPAARRHPARRPPLWDGLAMVLRTRTLMLVFGVRVLMRMGLRIVGPVFPLYVQGLAAPDARIASLTGLITGLSAAASAVGALALGRVADRVGPRRILLACGSASCVLYVLQAGTQTVGQIMALRVISGVAMGGIVASVSTLMAVFAPKGRYGAVYGVDTSMVAAANALAPMVGAMLTARLGLRSVFLGAAAMYGAAALIVAFVVPAQAAERTSRSATD